MGGIMRSRWLQHPGRRRATFIVLAALLTILSLWPEHYKAEAQLLPQDSGSGLSTALASQGGQGGLLSLGALLGNKQPVEADLTIARSHAVLDMVIDSLHLIGRSGYATRRQAEAHLRQKLGIVAIRGSIIQITTHDRDPALARALAAATANAIQNRLTAISLVEAAQKKAVATRRLKEVTVTLAGAQEALTRFRTEHNLPAPTQQLGSAVGLLASLSARVQAKEVELATRREFATDNSIEVQQAQAELAALKAQLAAAKAPTSGLGGPNLASMSLLDTEYFNLYRDERAAEILYEVYKRYLEEMAVDELSANQNLVLVEPAYIYPERQFNIWAVGGLSIIILIWLMSEYYLLSPPVGRQPA
ncbi:MAG: capsule biosynthesis protein [Caulobacteraceae bacterium]|nr:capsule biosynthesis protein [Caulobacteraceae bacterium]